MAICTQHYFVERVGSVCGMRLKPGDVCVCSASHVSLFEKVLQIIEK